jgi:hypothetical protein
MKKFIEGTKSVEHWKDRDIESYFLTEEFISTVSFDEFRKAAKENRYTESWNKYQMLTPNNVRRNWNNQHYKPLTWIYNMSYIKSEKIENGDIKDTEINIIKEYTTNEMSTFSDDDL